MILKTLVTLLLLCLTFGVVQAEDGFTSNKQIIDSLTTDALNWHIVENNSAEPDSLALDVSMLDFEKANYLRFIVGNIAAQKSIRFLRNYTGTSSFQGKVLVISVFNPEIKYSEPFEKTFFGRNFVKRQITVEVSGQIYSPLTSVVSQTINKSPRVVDEIAQGSIEDLERSAYRFTQGIKAGYSFWEKFYEPALAVTSVALIVYLFFTQRT